MKNLKRIISIGALLGLVALPGIVSATHQNQNGPADNPVRSNQDTTATIPVTVEKQDGEDKSPEVKTATEVEPASKVNNETTVNGIKVEYETELPVGSKTPDEIEAIVKAKFPTLTIKKIEVEKEDSQVVYEISFTNGQRFELAASDGSVVTGSDKDHIHNFLPKPGMPHFKAGQSDMN